MGNFRFPDSPIGHIRFLEFLLSEIAHQAGLKSEQHVNRLSSENIDRHIRGIKWNEALRRIESMKEHFKGPSISQLENVLRRELSYYTVDQLPNLLTPLIQEIRNQWENQLNAVKSLPEPETLKQSKSDIQPPINQKKYLLVGERIKLLIASGAVSCTQSRLAKMFDVSNSTISKAIEKVVGRSEFADWESLTARSVAAKFSWTGVAEPSEGVLDLEYLPDEEVEKILAKAARELESKGDREAEKVFRSWVDNASEEERAGIARAYQM